MARMHEVCLAFEQLVDAFYDVSLSEHDFVPHGHELVFHVGLEAMHEVNTPGRKDAQRVPS